jgi:DNA-binding YbaB/EbfC family protein
MDMNNLGEMLSGMQEKAKELEEKSENISFSAKSGGGMIKATINGKSELIGLEIDESLMDDKESLEILVITAVNDAIKMVEDNKKMMAMQMLGGFNK